MYVSFRKYYFPEIDSCAVAFSGMKINGFLFIQVQCIHIEREMCLRSKQLFFSSSFSVFMRPGVLSLSVWVSIHSASPSFVSCVPSLSFVQLLP